MSEMKSEQFPYKKLGVWLKALRHKKRCSLAEVSGAVEIDINQLSDYESGKARPSEDILILLISYFSLKEEEVAKAWDLAGYNNRSDTVREHLENVTVQSVFVLPMDARVVYTDMAHITSNKFGLTINFLQTDGIGGQALAVSRVGMSIEHARQLLKILEKSLASHQQKLLPAPDVSKKEQDEL